MEIQKEFTFTLNSPKKKYFFSELNPELKIIPTTLGFMFPKRTLVANVIMLTVFQDTFLCQLLTWPSVAVKRLFSLILLTKFLCFSHSIRKKDAFLYFIESVFFVDAFFLRVYVHRYTQEVQCLVQ